MLHCIRSQRHKWAWPVQASGLLLCSTITSDVLSSTASSDIDNGVFEEAETLRQKERGCSLRDDTGWDDQKCQKRRKADM